jgi:hypothetical protein
MLDSNSYAWTTFTSNEYIAPGGPTPSTACFIIVSENSLKKTILALIALMLVVAFAAIPQASGRIPDECGQPGFLESALREYPKHSDGVWRRQDLD